MYASVLFHVASTLNLFLLGAMNSTKTQEVLEQENDELVESLRTEVSALKSVSCVPIVT